MLKTFLLLFLTICLFGSAFLSNYAIPVKYSLNPIEYTQRWANYLGSFPVLSDEEKVTYITPGIEKSFDTAFTPWTPITIDSVLEVPTAIGLFMNNLITKVREFFITISLLFPTLYHNLTFRIGTILDPVRTFFHNAWLSIQKVFTAKEWWQLLPSMIIPVDWQAGYEAGDISPDTIDKIVKDYVAYQKFVITGVPPILS